MPRAARLPSASLESILTNQPQSAERLSSSRPVLSRVGRRYPLIVRGHASLAVRAIFEPISKRRQYSTIFRKPATLPERNKFIFFLSCFRFRFGYAVWLCPEMGVREGGERERTRTHARGEIRQCPTPNPLSLSSSPYRPAYAPVKKGKSRAFPVVLRVYRSGSFLSLFLNCWRNPFRVCAFRSVLSVQNRAGLTRSGLGALRKVWTIDLSCLG